MENITVTAIGVMHCEIKSTSDAPRNYDISEHVGALEIFPPYRDGLEQIKAGQTLVALFWLHQARRDMLKVFPRGDRSRGLHGVFATRSPMRPNPIALSELEVVAIKDGILTVKGVDVIDGTPLLDLKKKIFPEEHGK